jgi:hypothetical protein
MVFYGTVYYYLILRYVYQQYRAHFLRGRSPEPGDGMQGYAGHLTFHLQQVIACHQASSRRAGTAWPLSVQAVTTSQSKTKSHRISLSPWDEHALTGSEWPNKLDKSTSCLHWSFPLRAVQVHDACPLEPACCDSQHDQAGYFSENSRGVPSCLQAL